MSSPSRRRPAKPHGRACGILAVLVVLTACAVRPAPEPERRSATRPEGISVDVRNQARNAVTIYVWGETHSQRLGMVEALNEESFRFRWNFAGSVYFLMDFLAQGCALSEPIMVDDGDQLILTVQPIDQRRASRTACRR